MEKTRRIRKQKELVALEKKGTVLVQKKDSALIQKGLADLDGLGSRPRIDTLLQLGAGHYARGHYRKAFQVFATVLKKDKTVGDAIEGAGFSAFQQGRFSLAQSLLRRIPGRFSGAAFCTGQGMEMVYVEGGSFAMGGSPEEMELARQAEVETMPRLKDTKGKVPGDMDRIRRTLHPHRVTLSPFSLSRTCVPNALFEEFQSDHFSVLTDLGGPENPAITTWEKATAFCQWLSRREGRLYRLPTEAEWEYVARGWPSIRESAGKWSLPGIEPNRETFADMRGVVYQWCLDYYADDYYARSPARDPFGPEEGKAHSVRGGAFFCWDDNTCLFPWNRSESDLWDFDLLFGPSLCTDLVGLRLVCVCDRAPGFLSRSGG